MVSKSFVLLKKVGRNPAAGGLYCWALYKAIIMEKENIISELSKAGLTGKYGEPGDHRWVKIWVRDRYCCVYCGVSLLDDIIRMSSAQIDHLLPKYEY